VIIQTYEKKVNIALAKLIKYLGISGHKAVNKKGRLISIFGVAKEKCLLHCLCFFFEAGMAKKTGIIILNKP
jgi:hypothetical protein